MSKPTALLRALAGAAIAALVANPAPAQVIAGPWVELGADNALSVRVVVPSGVASCPRVVADGKAIEAKQRGAADGNFPVTVCVAAVPAATAALTIDGKKLPVLASAVNRIVVIGDTGCRIEGKAVQNCDDRRQWPFPVIAKKAAARKPDLVIHVGGYYDREDACPAGRRGCSGSPHGDNWGSWKADFFAPAAPLLAAAPWVAVRGNHELCRRGGKGWVRLLDPRPDLPDCADRSPPYRLTIGGLSLLVFDGADADDIKAVPAKVAAYAAQFASLLADAPAHSWLLTHRPVFALAQGDLGGVPLNQTEQAAIRGHVPPGLDLVLSGHPRDFASYDFGPARPAQLIVGDSGGTMLDLAKNPPVGAEIDGMRVRQALALERFGYFVLERKGDTWNGTLYSDQEEVLARCKLNGRDLDCRR